MVRSAEQLLLSIQYSSEGLTLAKLLALHPKLARRTVQRWLSQWITQGRIVGVGEGRARRYLAAAESSATAPEFSAAFPHAISLSLDSQEILTYVKRPLMARKPVGYQWNFLESYQPNQSWYLPAPLRRQLWKMGDAGQANLPAGTYGRTILNRLLIDLSWASSQLEGNTYSRLDTRELVEHGHVAANKTAFETQMILNHKAAIELLVENAEVIGCNRYTLFNLHSLLAENLLSNPADEGRIRQHTVEIGQSVYRPLAVPAQISEALDKLLNKASRIIDPFEQSFFMMVHLPYLQPFADVNKRVSRLAANLPLLRANLCPLTFLGVSEAAYSCAILGVYELTRIELLRDLYLWAYERSTQEYVVIKRDLVEPDPVRLAYGVLIKRMVHDVVIRPEQDALTLLQGYLQEHGIPEEKRADVRALVLEELRHLHEGVLVRYGLRPMQLAAWQAKHSVNKGMTDE